MPIRSRTVSRYITLKEADKTLASLASESTLVCYAVCKGSPWHAQWAGKIRNPHSGRSVLTAGQTANLVSIHEFGAIVSAEDEEIARFCFRDPKSSVDSEFEVNLVIARLLD